MTNKVAVKYLEANVDVKSNMTTTVNVIITVTILERIAVLSIGAEFFHLIMDNI